MSTSDALQQSNSHKNTTPKPLHVQIYSIPQHVSVNYSDHHQEQTKCRYARKTATEEAFPQQIDILKYFNPINKRGVTR